MNIPIQPPPTGRGRLLLVLTLALALAAIVFAAPASRAQTSARVERAIVQVETSADALRLAREESVRAHDGPSRDAVRETLQSVREAAKQASLDLAPELELVNARVSELGDAPEGGEEAPDVQVERTALAKASGRIDSALKRAGLIQVEAGQLNDQIAAAQADELGRRLNVRSRSPLDPAFWVEAFAEAPDAGSHLGALSRETARRWDAGGIVAAVPVIVALIAALLLVGPGRTILRRAGVRYIWSTPAANAGFRRSAYALWEAVLGAVLPAIGLTGLFLAVQSHGILAAELERLAGAVSVGLILAVVTAALSEALLLVDRPNDRLLPLTDASAKALRPYGLSAAAAVLVYAVVEAYIGVMAPPAAVAAALNAVVALASSGLIVAVLVQIGRLRSDEETANQQDGLDGRAVAFALLVLWPFSLFVLIAGGRGYVAYAISMAFWVIWAGLVGASFYLLSRFADDACRTFFVNRSRLTRNARARLGVRDNTMAQFGVVLSAVLRILLLMLALGAVLVPFGAGFISVFDLFGRLRDGVRFGEVVLSPAAIGRALLVLVITLGIARLARRWLVRSYLPTTRLDAGAVNSIGVIAGYVGVCVSVLWALAALGVRVQQLAFVLSALSVGIGFGLQAITQNFVSGLILLAERPVKIGDRVRLGDQEGRVVKISVRATQIVTDAEARLVVPNSELITKMVQTVAVDPAATSVGACVAVDFDANLEQVRDLIVQAIRSHSAPVSEPAPSAFISKVSDGQAVFTWNATLEAGADRDRVRGELWLAIITALRAGGVALGAPVQRVSFERLT